MRVTVKEIDMKRCGTPGRAHVISAGMFVVRQCRNVVALRGHADAATLVKEMDDVMEHVLGSTDTWQDLGRKTRNSTSAVSVPQRQAAGHIASPRSTLPLRVSLSELTCFGHECVDAS